MISSTTLAVVSMVLIALCVGGVLIATLYPLVAGESPLDRKRNAIAASRQRLIAAPSHNSNTRKRSVEDTLQEAAHKQASATRSKKPTLRNRIREAGLSWTNRFYYAVCVCTAGISILFSLLVLRFGIAPAIGFGLSAGLVLPHFYIARRRKKRFNAFSADFPTAVDLIVRGIKSGLPVADCFKIVAAEVQEPVRSEFKVVIEDQTLGLPLDEAVQRTADRVPLDSARFFAIVIGIQSRTGGNLSETLGNLSKVLRERKKMAQKIQAVSSEAKSSAMIIGSLPLAISGLLYLLATEYIMLLFSTTIGNVALVGAGLWMLIGVLVMRKMINFDM